MGAFFSYQEEKLHDELDELKAWSRKGDIRDAHIGEEGVHIGQLKGNASTKRKKVGKQRQGQFREELRNYIQSDRVPSALRETNKYWAE